MDETFCYFRVERARALLFLEHFRANLNQYQMARRRRKGDARSKMDFRYIFRAACFAD